MCKNPNVAPKGFKSNLKIEHASEEDKAKASREGQDFANRVMLLRREQLTRQSSKNPTDQTPELMGGPRLARWEGMAEALRKEVTAGRLSRAQAEEEMRKHLWRSGVPQTQNPFN